jgi:hypothetical protein
LSVGRLYPEGSISTPTHAVSAPAAPTISLSFAPFGHNPVAHRQSVPCWLAGSSRAVSTPACDSSCNAGPSLVQLPTQASASNVQASEPRASARRPSPSSGTRVPPPGCPASPFSGRLHYQLSPRPGRAPSTAPPGPPEADPDPGPRLRHRGLRAPAHKTCVVSIPNAQPLASVWRHDPAAIRESSRWHLQSLD